MNILVYEYFTAQAPTASTAAEGLFILKALVKTFTDCGHQVTTVLHPCLESFFNTPTGSFIAADAEIIGELFQNTSVIFGTRIKDAVQNCNSGLIIAPEEKGILQHLSIELERWGRINLGCPSKKVINAADKYLTHTLLKSKKITTPFTKLLRGNSNISDEIKENFDYPFILKPADGCNSHQVYLVENQTDLIAALEVLGERLLLVQEYIEGEHLSVTLLGKGKDVYPLSLNSQVFRGRKPFQYCGGTAGIKHPLQEQIFSQAIRAWQTAMISGLGGVDLVVGPSGIYVVEINPRPTAPVIALASCPNYNLGEKIIKAALNQRVSKPLFNKAIRFYA